VTSTGVYIHTNFSCYRRVLHVPLPPHTLAMLIGPQAAYRAYSLLESGYRPTITTALFGATLAVYRFILSLAFISRT